MDISDKLEKLRDEVSKGLDQLDMGESVDGLIFLKNSIRNNGQ